MLVTFTSNPFAFDKFKDIATAFTVNLYDDGVVLDPGSVGLLSYAHPTIKQLISDINTGSLSVELFLTLLEHQQQASPNSTLKNGFFYDGCVLVTVIDWRPAFILSIGSNSSSSAAAATAAASQPWSRRTSFFNAPVTAVSTKASSSQASSIMAASTSKLLPETHKILLKPTPECWRYALQFLSKSSAELARVLEVELFKLLL